MLCLVAGGFVAAAVAVAQSPSAEYPLFATQEPLALRIYAPIRQLKRDGDDRPEHDARLEVIGADGIEAALDVEIRVRGKSRREWCDFPPLDIDFSRQQVADSVFAGQNELKLVTLCKASSTYERYLYQEHLIYRMFNALTDRSMRVRWAEVVYIDESGRKPREEMAPAFFIEEDREVAGRTGLDVIETADSLDLDRLAGDHAALLSVFQYMIGNTDWDIHPADGDDCCHNGKPIGAADGATFLLPYDFDQSGLINAVYAVPSPVLQRRGVRSVTQRHYRGYCLHNDAAAAAVAFLNSRREALEQLIDDPLYPAMAQNGPRRFLQKSFERLNDPEGLANRVLRDCRP